MSLGADSTSHSTTTSPPRRRWLGPMVMAIKAGLALIVIAFVGRALVIQFKQVAWDEFHFAMGTAIAATVALLGVSGMQLLMFRTLLAAYGYRLRWPTMLGAAWVPPLGKYIPGKVASVAGAVYLQRKNGVPGAVAVSVALMLDGLAVLAGLIVSAPLLLWHEQVNQRLPGAWIWAAVLVAAGLAILHPRVFAGAVNLLLKLMHRPPLSGVPRVKSYLPPVMAAFGQWVFAGLGLWLMAGAVTDVPVTQLGLFIATAALAMTLSYLALFAPGGLGVREGLYLLTLGPVVGPTNAAVIVVAMRIVQTLIEVTLACVGLMMLRRGGAMPESAAEAAPSVTLIEVKDLGTEGDSPSRDPSLRSG